MAFWMESGEDDAWSSIPTQIFSQRDLRSNLSNYESPSKVSVNRNSQTQIAEIEEINIKES